MKSERRSFPRSAQPFPRRILGNADRALVETAVAFPYPVQRIRGKVAKKRPSNAIDLEKLLHFSQQLYAHALTLQEVIRNEGEVRYTALRPRYDRQAAQQFEIFYRTFKRPSGFRKRGAGSYE